MILRLYYYYAWLSAEQNVTYFRMLDLAVRSIPPAYSEIKGHENSVDFNNFVFCIPTISSPLLILSAAKGPQPHWAGRTRWFSTVIFGQPS
jgi:hypothetical protein